MNKTTTLALLALFVAGLTIPVVADTTQTRSTTFTSQLPVTNTIGDGNVVGSTNPFSTEWLGLVDDLPDLSAYSFEYLRQPRSIPNTYDFIMNAGVYDVDELLPNGPPDPKKHNPINIDDDRDLRKFPGSGSESDPYIIEGLYFENSRKNLIQIQYTDVYIVIRGNYFNGLDSGNLNILVNQASHVSIEGNEMYSNSYGISVSDSTDITISNNLIYNHVNDGILVSGTTGLNIDGNTVTNNENGVTVSESNAVLGDSFSNNAISLNTITGLTMSASHGFVISENTLTSNGGAGLVVIDSNGNSFLDNFITDNGYQGGTTTNAAALVIDGNKLKIDASFAGSGFFLDPSEENLVYNNTISNNAGVGMYVEESDYNTFEENSFVDNGLTGLVFINSSSNDVTNNDITGNGYSSTLQTMALDAFKFRKFASFAGSGFFLDPSDNNTVSENDISYNFGDGLVVDDSDMNTVSDNDINENGLTGLTVLNSHDNDFLDNDIMRNGYGTASQYIMNQALSPLQMRLYASFAGSGFFLDPSTGNELDGNVMTDNAGSGLLMEDSDLNSVTNNQMTDNGVDGISIINSDDNVISGNTLTSNGASATSFLASIELNADTIKLHASFAGSGFFLDPSEGNNFTDNYISDNSGSGVYLLSSDDTLIEGNTIEGNDYHGVFLENSSFNIINMNVIDNNGAGSASALATLSLDASFAGSGFFLDPSHDNTITFNNFTGNAAHGFFSEASTGTHFSDNRLMDHPLYGVLLDDTSTTSTVEGNNFDNNNPDGAQAADNGEANVFTTNFWTDHDNTDANYDGIADEPYVLDGDAGNAEETASNIANGLNFFEADDAESYPQKLNAGSEGEPLKFVVELGAGYRALSLDLSTFEVYLQGHEQLGSATAESYVIQDILNFRIEFNRLEVNNLVNLYAAEEGLQAPFFVVFEINGRMNDNLLDITAFDDVEINQTGQVITQSIAPFVALALMIPIAIKLKKKSSNKYSN